MISEERKRIPFDEWKENRQNLDLVVVSYLLEHFKTTMNRYVLCTPDEFEEMLQLQYPDTSDLGKTLNRLESENILRCITIKGRGYKIYLTDQFMSEIIYK